MYRKNASSGNASGSLRIAVSAVIERVSFCQFHVFVHEYDGKDLSGFVCLIAVRLVEVQAGMKADFTCTCKLIAYVYLEQTLACQE